MKTKIFSLLVVVASLPLHAATLTWDADTNTPAAQDGAGNWTSAATSMNWWNGAANVVWNNAAVDSAIFGAGSGAAGVITVPSVTTNTVGNITFNAPGSGGYNLAAGSSTTSKLNLSGTPTITVASGVFATNTVVLTGTSFTKLGAGTFVLKTGAPNLNAGPTVVGAGALIVGATAGRLSIPGDLTITNGATVQLLQGEQIADTGILTVDGGTFDTGGKAETVGGFIFDNNAQSPSSSSSTGITNNGAFFDLRSGLIAPNLAGPAGLTKTTAGTVTLANGGGANTFTGPVLVSAGILQLNHSGIGQGLPAVVTTITNTGAIQLLHDTEFHTNGTLLVMGGTFELLAHNDTVTTLVLDNGGQILNGGNTSKTLTILTNMDFRNGICASKLGGAAVMNKSTAGTVTLTMDNANSGGTLISAGILQLGDGSNTNRGQFGTGAVTNNSVVVLNHSGAFTIANVISGSGAITNLGGTASFTAANTYTGNTVVSGGTLLVNNPTGSGTGSGAVNVQSGATLGGTGTIGGAANLLAGATLAPGNGSFGKLTVNGALTLNGAATSTFKVDGSTPTNDVVALGSTVSYGGTLNIVTSGTFTAGQTFTLFSGAGATSASSFASISGSPGPDLEFAFANGVLSVNSTGPSLPKLTVAQSGNTLTISWNDDSFSLQSQTNSLTTGLSGNWTDYPGASPVTITINPGAPAVFFRLMQAPVGN